MRHGHMALLITGLMGGFINTSAAKNNQKPSTIRESIQNFYKSQVELTVKPGNKRSLGILDMMFPLLSRRQKDMLFLDVRGVKDNKNSREFNLGLGYRRAIERWMVAGDHVILGGYGYYDTRRSSNGFTYRQGTIGVEALHPWWQARINGYYPDRHQHTVSGSSGYFTGFSYVLTGGREGAMPGWDAEVGVRLPAALPIDQEIFLFAGGYQFKRKGYPTIDGPRVRAEYWVYDVLQPWGLRNARLKVGGETAYDKVRGTNTFFELGLMIPLNVFNKKQEPYTTMDRTMTLPVQRDVDVVAATTTATLTQENGVPTKFIHVRENVPYDDDEGDGTAGRPFKRIQTGVNAALAQTTPNPVVIIHRTAAGYTADINQPVVAILDDIPETLKSLTLASPGSTINTALGPIKLAGSQVRPVLLASADDQATDRSSTVLYRGTPLANKGSTFLINGLNVQMENHGTVVTNAVAADNGAKIRIDDCTISTMGTKSHAVMAYTGNTNMSATAIINNSTITSVGDGVHGADAVISVAGSSIYLTGDATRGIYGENTTEITVDNSKIQTTGDVSPGVYSRVGGTLVVRNSTITTKGNHSAGAHSNEGSFVSIIKSAITTHTDSDSYGVLASDSRALVSGSTLTTKGARGFGIYSHDGGNVECRSSSIRTAGADGYGVIADDASTAYLPRVHVKASGNSAYGVVTSNTAIITLDYSTIQGGSGGATDLWAEVGTTINITNSTYHTTHGGGTINT